MALRTVQSGASSMNSVVITPPAESSGYLSSSLIILRVSGSAWARIRLTTLAGISSTRSVASSTHSSSTTLFSSRSVRPRISASCVSGPSSANTSAARSLGHRRNSTGIFSSGRSSNTAARSGAFMVDMTSRRLWYFLASSRLASIWRSTAMVLFAIKNPPCAAVVSTQTHKEGEIFQNEASVPCAKNAHTNSKWLRIEPPPAPLHRNNGCHYIQFYIGSQDYRESPCLTTCLLCWIFIIMVPCFAAKAL